MKRKDIKEYRIWQAMKARCYAPSFEVQTSCNGKRNNIALHETQRRLIHKDLLIDN